jgi:hypothetical protein
MNQFERDIGGRPAVLQYLDGEYRVLTPGTYVVCAVTGVKIPLEALRYWSVDLQEAYAGPAAGEVASIASRKGRGNYREAIACARLRSGALSFTQRL